MLRALRKRTSRLGMSLILEGVELPNLFIYEVSSMKLSVMRIAQNKKGERRRQVPNRELAGGMPSIPFALRHLTNWTFYWLGWLISRPIGCFN